MLFLEFFQIIRKMFHILRQNQRLFAVSLCNGTDGSAGIAVSQIIIRNIFCDYAARTNDNIIPDMYAANDNGIAGDPHIIPILSTGGRTGQNR